MKPLGDGNWQDEASGAIAYGLDGADLSGDSISADGSSVDTGSSKITLDTGLVSGGSIGMFDQPRSSGEESFDTGLTWGIDSFTFGTFSKFGKTGTAGAFGLFALAAASNVVGGGEASAGINGAKDLCGPIAKALTKKFGGEVWRLTPKFGSYIDRAVEPVSGTIDSMFGGIENWNEHLVNVQDGMVRDPMMTGDNEAIPVEQWQRFWNNFSDHNFGPVP